ncbi:prophage-encoded bactoprenol-linked glucose translocase [Escherichia coli]|nr:prophage-encoded bactoprenol-linked glucose translocase [Escherichia coli]SQL76126.1 prophage-encoded bactoprenol-linked glucose translocase [Escherichia coli]
MSAVRGITTSFGNSICIKCCRSAVSIYGLCGVTLQDFQNSLIFIMLKLFAKYTSIGVINTLIHWVVFAVCIYAFHTSQSLGNFAGFVVAVSFSFFANARFTFKSSTTTMRYMLYVGFMGSLSAIIGWCADKSGMSPIITLILFSAISLVCGFIYSKFIVFRGPK